MGLFSRPSPPQVQAPPPPAPEPVQEEPGVDLEAEQRRRRRFALSGVRTGPLGAGTPEQTGRQRLLGA